MAACERKVWARHKSAISRSIPLPPNLGLGRMLGQDGNTGYGRILSLAAAHVHPKAGCHELIKAAMDCSYSCQGPFDSQRHSTESDSGIFSYRGSSYQSCRRSVKFLIVHLLSYRASLGKKAGSIKLLNTYSLPTIWVGTVFSWAGPPGKCLPLWSFLHKRSFARIPISS